MIKQLLNSVIAKYCELSVSRRPIICRSRRPLADKSRYFAKPRPITVYYFATFKENDECVKNYYANGFSSKFIFFKLNSSVIFPAGRGREKLHESEQLQQLTLFQTQLGRHFQSLAEYLPKTSKQHKVADM